MCTDSLTESQSCDWIYKIKNNLFTQYYKKVIYYSDRRLTIQFGNKKSFVFSMKKFELHVNSLFLQKLSTLPMLKFNTSTRTNLTLQTKFKLLRTHTMCSTFALVIRYDNSNFKFIGNVFCPNTKCPGILCVHKKSFPSLSRSDYECPQCTSTCQVQNIPLEEQTICYS